jgi:predicted acyltransferase
MPPGRPVVPTGPRGVPERIPGPVADSAPERDLAIDRFRGALVILMVAGNLAAGVDAVPAFLKHAPDVGFTIADTVAPAFVFAIGLTFGPSFRRRRAVSRSAAYRHVMFRYLALVGIGAIIAAGSTSVAGMPATWGVLQALGVAGLICLAVIRFPTAVRIAVGGGLLIGYQVLIDHGARELVLGASHGGLLGAVSWAALLVLSTAVADLIGRGPRVAAVTASVLVVVAVAAVLLVPVSKNRVSLSYVLLTLALSTLVYLLVEVGSRALRARPGFLCWWGQNPLVLYVLHLVLLGLVVLPTPTWWYVHAPIWLAAAQLAVILAMMSLFAWLLHRRALRVRL